MPFNDPLAERQADAGTGHVATVEPLEDHEDAIIMLWLDADALIVNADRPVGAGRPFRCDCNLRSLAAAELDSVLQQILKQLTQLTGVSEDTRKLTDVDDRLRLLDAQPKIR